ncbi:Uncharacterised protein [uncultured Ruminococcus sp.]|uniref:hypothetical protein n=1 Tax=Huintestinicola butyrica TaxID=2981728 RepID=UPI0008211048|nr:hypothetical protein [Huintestinicola butyrica]MCU6727988.1 hypothetical protein [Huintestinicola butyrica]SCI99514.1 Uncharacterised protein [uncultured Ruminococcus sp.]
MGIISEAQRAFPQAKIPHEEEYYRTVIAACADIYKGEPPWAYVKRSGLYGKGERRMSMLGGAYVQQSGGYLLRRPPPAGAG